MMRSWLLLPIAVLLAGILSAQAAGDHTPLRSLKLSQLEQHLSRIDTELGQLARDSLRSGIGTVGFRSEDYPDPHHTEWIQIELESAAPIDQITLVPVVWRDTQTGFQADGFPVEFKLIVGTAQNPKGTIVASYSAEDHLLPRIAPVTASFPPVTATWIRVEATLLSPRAWDDRYLLQLAEIMIFSGSDNIALHRPVQVSSHGKGGSASRSIEALVDGQVPYQMDAAQGEKSIAFLKKITGIKDPELSIDLGEAYVLNRIHLHTLELTDSIPQGNEPGTGTPIHARFEGANQADFSDAVLLTEYRLDNMFQACPILMMRFPETRCRYIRMSILEPFKGTQSSWLGFAELEFFSKGRNVALGKTVESSFNTEGLSRSLSALTDGRNLYGNILPIRAWMNQLTRRHELETERPLIQQELALRYEGQKNNLRRISWLAAFLLFAGITAVMLQRINRQRAIAHTRERIAANLHDELGANLHAIGLLGDFAKKIVARKNAQNEWAELAEVVDEVRSLTEETGETARYCTNMLETKEIHKNVVGEMKRANARLLADLEHEATFPDEEKLHRLKPRNRIDLYLFYKECLTNILRHSGATHVSTQLTANDRDIRLSVTDNGHSLPGNEIPKSLCRRARMLGGSVSFEVPAGGGTQIILQISPRGSVRFIRS
ncbi:MAG: histidine kinase [Akkermansiaceae bacterium]|jgi:signal transduction histidine kinase|nr:histidine kinase [Akkermansiaceae bacterium]MDP4791995.1 histidine kinase [Verrucomicrobiales bacterium]MDP4848384.1 histidine kinase [Akkermansiaceae bacterium]MDP4898359.1 histidine kinase [Akkermansiaceae bacterium]MDP4996618.1 histidine kinase [Akkermansiaceae bacterium]